MSSKDVPTSYARATPGFPPGKTGRVPVSSGKGEVLRSARINAIALEQLEEEVENDVQTLNIEETVSQSLNEMDMTGGGEDDETMSGDGAGPGEGLGAGAGGPGGLSGTAELTPEPLTGTPYDLTAPGGVAVLAAQVVGESLSAAYRAVTHQEVKRMMGELAGAGAIWVDGLEVVTRSGIDLFQDVVGAEAGAVAVDTARKTGALGYWLLKGVGGIFILGLSLANFVAGTGAQLAQAGSGGIRAMARALRSAKNQTKARDTIIENSPLAILTAIAVFNQLGMLPLMTIGSMAAAGLQQQISPTGRSLWLVYLFNWWVTRSKDEKESIRAYTKEVASKGAVVAMGAAGKGAGAASDAVGRGAELVATAIRGAYERANAPAPQNMRDLEAKAKLAKVSGEDPGAVKAMAAQAAVISEVLEMDEDEVDAGSAAAKLAALKKGVAKAIERVGAKKGGQSPGAGAGAGAGSGVATTFRAPGFGTAPSGVPGSATPAVPLPSPGSSARPYDLRREAAAIAVEERRKKQEGKPAKRSASRSREPGEGRGGKGGKRTKKAKRKTYRKKRMMKKTRKFIY